MKKHKSSSCSWNASSWRASWSLLGCWVFGSTQGMTEIVILLRSAQNCRRSSIFQGSLPRLSLLTTCWTCTIHCFIAMSPMEWSFGDIPQPAQTFCSCRRAQLGFLPRPTGFSITNLFSKISKLSPFFLNFSPFSTSTFLIYLTSSNRIFIILNPKVNHQHQTQSVAKL